MNNLKLLKKKIKEKKIDYYFLSTTDEFLNEYVPEYNMRLKWLTNFSGSNGAVLISEKESFFFTDGRYLNQAKKELTKDYDIHDQSIVSIINFIGKKLKKKKILIDTKLFSTKLLNQIKKKCEISNNKIIHDDENIIDSLWIDRPEEMLKKFFVLKKKYSGDSHTKKISQIKPLDNSIIILSSPESICWLLNIRGYDLPNTPVVFCRMIITKNKNIIYVNKKKIPPIFFINYPEIVIRDICNFNNDIKNIKNKTIQIDDQISYFYYDILNKKNNVTIKIDPCNNLKSIKNNIEIKCSKSAHLNDGIALVKFFYWLEKNIDKKVTEFSASKKLYEYRRQNKDFFSESFPTISATGPNGSIIHYKPKVKSSTLEKDQLYLCDSGGQYFGGTTDITRTIHIGKKKPAKNYKKLYTKVLMGHIDISILKFPLGTTGSQIDTIARANLWSDGLDYNHGTGHGVGSFLGVHEGPQSISKKLNNVILKPGMILSNEPGYYENGKFGIRIENLIIVKKSVHQNFLEFETLSLFPYETKLVDFSLLSLSQKSWIQKYHSLIYKRLSPRLDRKYKSWLKNKISFKI